MDGPRGRSVVRRIKKMQKSNYNGLQVVHFNDRTGIPFAGTKIMELQPQQTGSTLVLSPAGRIDHTHADAFKSALDPHLRDCVRDGASLVLDFAQVSYISSIGLRALMVAIKQVKGQGGRMVLAGLTPLVLE